MVQKVKQKLRQKEKKMNKGFWMAKAADGDPVFDDSSKIETKRSHQWFVDAAEMDLFAHKKQAVQTSSRTLRPGISSTDVPSWYNTTGFQSVPNQYIHRLFGSEDKSTDFAQGNACAAGTGSLNASFNLSISHDVENPDACFNYSGIRKVKVNRVKDCEDHMLAPKGHSFTTGSSSDVSAAHALNRERESNFTSMGHAYVREGENVTLMGHTYNREDGDAGSTSPTYIKEDDSAISISESCGKDDANMISFGGFPDAHDVIPVGRPISSFDEPYCQPSVQTPEAVDRKELNVSNANAVLSNTRTEKLKVESVSKNKPVLKTTRKEAPNSFPSNVRSLISTGMLDGVPVKYVFLSRELYGIIKGSGYLCGCQSCNYSKVLNAYEFERHAGCKTKHPNNHIYFENGKTIYQIVQELRSTPESMLFDVIQTVFGAPINQKSFRIWTESFQAATRELQRIYGKEELHL